MVRVVRRAVGAIISLGLESKTSSCDGLLGGIGKLFVLPAIGNRTIKEGLEPECKTLFCDGLLGGIGKLFVLPAIGNRTLRMALYPSGAVRGDLSSARLCEVYQRRKQSFKNHTYQFDLKIEKEARTCGFVRHLEVSDREGLRGVQYSS